MTLLLNKTDEKELKVDRTIYLENVVEYNGEHYYISSLFADEGFQTLVFHYDTTNGIDNWNPLYIHMYRTSEEMERGHSYACTHVGECIRCWKMWIEGDI